LPVNNPLPRPRFPCSKRQGQQLGRRVVGNAPAVLDEEFGFNRLVSHENRVSTDCAIVRAAAIFSEQTHFGGLAFSALKAKKELAAR